MAQVWAASRQLVRAGTGGVFTDHRLASARPRQRRHSEHLVCRAIDRGTPAIRPDLPAFSLRALASNLFGL